MALPLIFFKLNKQNAKTLFLIHQCRLIKIIHKTYIKIWILILIASLLHHFLRLYNDTKHLKAMNINLEIEMTSVYFVHQNLTLILYVSCGAEAQGFSM